jgi:hypothetical protein
VKLVVLNEEIRTRWTERSPAREGDQVRIIRRKPGEPDYLFCYSIGAPSVRIWETVQAHTGRFYYREVLSADRETAREWLTLLEEAGENGVVKRLHRAS